MTQKNKIFFPNLDGLRFFSFLLVFFAHSFSTENELIKQATWYKIIKIRMFSDGDIGVSFFFVLSGFLISFLLLKENEYTNKIHIRSFYIRRLLRIWPLYYFVVFFGFIIFPILKSYFGQTPNETANPVLCSLFLNNFDRIYNGSPDASIIAILWSVAIEEQFYLIWPILFLIIPKKYFGFIFIIVLLLSTLFRIFFVHLTNIDLHTFGVITDMAIGGLGAYLIINNIKFQNKIETFPRKIIVLLYILILVYIFFKNEIFASSIMQILKRIIMGSTFVLIILEQNFAKESLFKVGNFKIISKLGKYTYGLYCLHGIAILISITILNKLSLNQNSLQIWLIELPLSFILSIIFSWVSYHYFESFFLKLKDKFSYISKD